ncbi:unnamed protein product, partial [Rodentolepis nana]|uniref:Mitochondrial 28S ribosomal protein S33 n=1 Tax=Rodentolepis nana TaxID=102285 RepID=A0A0R3TU52_RODNA
MLGLFSLKSVVQSLTRISTESLLRTTPVIAQPIRGVQRQEAKRYYVEDGTADPPVQVVIDRFKRLRWGAYIHPRAGRRKHLYR